MIRPDGTRFDDRTRLLDALTVSPARPGSTDHRVRQPAVVCAVMKEVPDGPQQHRNIRAFTPRVFAAFVDHVPAAAQAARTRPGFLAAWPAQGMGCEIWPR
jgi:hypothetical protein